MYIRQTTTRSKKDGSSYQSYRLVESYRIGDKVKQHTLLNLGAEFSIPRGSWVELTGRIEAILLHQPSLLVVDEIIVMAAIGRTAAPGSELSTHRWLQRESVAWVS